MTDRCPAGSDQRELLRVFREEDLDVGERKVTVRFDVGVLHVGLLEHLSEWNVSDSVVGPAWIYCPRLAQDVRRDTRTRDE